MLGQDYTFHLYLAAFVSTSHKNVRALFDMKTSYEFRSGSQFAVSTFHLLPFAQLSHMFVQLLSLYHNSTGFPILSVCTRHSMVGAVGNVHGIFQIFQFTHPLAAFVFIVTTNSELVDLPFCVNIREITLVFHEPLAAIGTILSSSNQFVKTSLTEYFTTTGNLMWVYLYFETHWTRTLVR